MSRVLFLTESFHPVLGGGEQHILRLARRLVALGDAATVVTRLATRASAVASVSARRFVGNHRSGTPYRPAIATISLKRGWIIGSAAHPRATRQALGNRSAAILSKTSTGMLPSVESCLSNGGKNSRSVFAK